MHVTQSATSWCLFYDTSKTTSKIVSKLAYSGQSRGRKFAPTEALMYIREF